MASNSNKHHTLVDLASARSQHKYTQDDSTEKKYSEEPKCKPTINRLAKKHDQVLPPISSQQDRAHPCKRAEAVSENNSFNTSPWTSYEKLYTLQFGAGEYFIVAEKKKPEPAQSPVVIMKNFAGSTVDNCVQSIQRIQHGQFVSPRQFFSIASQAFVAFEFLPLSLSEIAGHPLMDDIRLASILGQIVDGLIYLEHKGLEHTRLTYRNILVDSSGNVKLWGQEYIQRRSDTREHMKALGLITMELVQGYAKEDGNIGIERPDRCSLGVEFLSATEYALRADDLTKNSLLKLPWHKSRLAGLVSLVCVWADRGYKFPA